MSKESDNISESIQFYELLKKCSKKRHNDEWQVAWRVLLQKKGVEKYIYNCICGKFPNANDRDNVYGEVLIKLYKNIDISKIQPASSKAQFYAFLNIIIFHCFIDSMKGSNKSWPGLPGFLGTGCIGEKGEPSATIEGLSPEDHTAFSEFCEYLLQCIDELDSEQCVIINQYFFEELSKSEIGRNANVNKSTSGAWVNKAVEALKKLLGRHYKDKEIGELLSGRKLV